MECVRSRSNVSTFTWWYCWRRHFRNMAHACHGIRSHTFSQSHSHHNGSFDIKPPPRNSTWRRIQTPLCWGCTISSRTLSDLIFTSHKNGHVSASASGISEPEDAESTMSVLTLSSEPGRTIRSNRTCCDTAATLSEIGVSASNYDSTSDITSTRVEVHSYRCGEHTKCAQSRVLYVVFMLPTAILGQPCMVQSAGIVVRDPGLFSPSSNHNTQ